MVALAGGVWSGYATGFRFVMGAGAVVAAIVAGRVGPGPARTRWWLAVAAIAVALGGISLPYGPSFKIVSVAGVVALPVSAYLFGRLSRLPYPTPALLAVAAVWYLFDKNFTIYGGNIASTMAGEFAFSISLALAVAYLGVLIHGLRTGTHRAAAAVLLALVGCCHLIPAFFAIGATVVIVALHIVGEVDITGPRQRAATAVAALLVLAIAIGGAVAVLAGVAPTGPVILVTVVAAVAVAIASVEPPRTRGTPHRAGGCGPDVVARHHRVRRRAARRLVGAALLRPDHLPQRHGLGEDRCPCRGRRSVEVVQLRRVAVAGPVRHAGRRRAGAGGCGARRAVPEPDRLRPRHHRSRAVPGLPLRAAGRLWNARLLPFWYLVVYLLAAIGVGEVVRALAQVFAARPDRPLRSVRWLAAPLCLLVLGTYLGAQLHNLPGGRQNADGSYRVFASVGVPGLFSLDLPDAVGIDVKGRNFVTDWSRWNYSGYERKDAYPEYRSIVSTMADVGRERGCGMSLWEYSAELNDYGTPMALMLLPHWTDGCIGSMEGLYFEASATTPFHFLMQSELSAKPSRAQRDLPYRELDLDAGVQHLQLMGVKYYLARSPQAVAAADAHPDLTAWPRPDRGWSTRWPTRRWSSRSRTNRPSPPPASTSTTGSVRRWTTPGTVTVRRSTGSRTRRSGTWLCRRRDLRTGSASTPVSAPTAVPSIPPPSATSRWAATASRSTSTTRGRRCW